MITKERKYFTPQEANRSLPLVGQIVADILEKGQALRAIEAEGAPQDASLHTRERQLRTEIEALFRELESVGCEYKDPSFTTGLVDFPAKLDGEDVLLCWQPGEACVEYYHGLEEGAIGRRRLPPELLAPLPAAPSAQPPVDDVRSSEPPAE
jgi:hypothetical protein